MFCLLVSSVCYTWKRARVQKMCWTKLLKGIYCAVVSTCIRWLKFLLLAASHPLVESVFVELFWLKYIQTYQVFIRIKKVVSFFYAAMKDESCVQLMGSSNLVIAFIPGILTPELRWIWGSNLINLVTLSHLSVCLFNLPLHIRHLRILCPVSQHGGNKT